MDRTLIAPYKAEEKELGEKLYNSLQALFLLNAPSEELRKCASAEMFLKQNAQAFFHVIHYLFRLLDAAEFKKRFFWPLTDKRSEANFRTATVEYLKFLNDKHKLQWTNIKSYLVVMPGGMKFILFLLKLVALVVSELMRLRKKELFGDADAVEAASSMLSIAQMKQQNKLFKEYASAYLMELEIQKGKLQTKTEQIKQQMAQLAAASGISVEQQLDADFHAMFEKHIQLLFQQKLQEPQKQLMALQQPLLLMSSSINAFTNKDAEIKLDKHELSGAVQELQRMLEVAASSTSTSSSSHEDININSMLKIINSVYARLQQYLLQAKELPEPDAFVKHELTELLNEINKAQAQLNDFRRDIITRTTLAISKHQLHTPCRAEHASKIGSVDESKLKSKYVHTPLIQLDSSESSRNITRISLFADEMKREAMETHYGSFLAQRTRTVQPKSDKLENSFDLNNTTFSRSKIIDPMHLLRTIEKNKTKNCNTNKSNLTGLSEKWKQRQQLLLPKIDNDFLLPISPQHDGKNRLYAEYDDAAAAVVKEQPLEMEMTPLRASPVSLMPRAPVYNQATALNTSGGAVMLYTKKLNAVKKVQDASLNLNNLSTSPSGRLEPLVAVDSMYVPRVVLDEPSNAKKLETFELEYSPSTEIWSKKENDENEQHQLNALEFNFNKLSLECEKDAIFNISDTVLKDLNI